MNRNWLYLIPLGGALLVLFLAYEEDLARSVPRWPVWVVAGLWGVYSLCAAVYYSAGWYLRSMQRRRSELRRMRVLASDVEINYGPIAREAYRHLRGIADAQGKASHYSPDSAVVMSRAFAIVVLAVLEKAGSHGS